MFLHIRDEKKSFQTLLRRNLRKVRAATDNFFSRPIFFSSARIQAAETSDRSIAAQTNEKEKLRLGRILRSNRFSHRDFSVRGPSYLCCRSLWSIRTAWVAKLYRVPWIIILERGNWSKVRHQPMQPFLLAFIRAVSRLWDTPLLPNCCILPLSNFPLKFSEQQ